MPTDAGEGVFAAGRPSAAVQQQDGGMRPGGGTWDAEIHLLFGMRCGFQCIPPTHTDLKPPSILR